MCLGHFKKFSLSNVCKHSYICFPFGPPSFLAKKYVPLWPNATWKVLGSETLVYMHSFQKWLTVLAPSPHTLSLFSFCTFLKVATEYRLSWNSVDEKQPWPPALAQRLSGVLALHLLVTFLCRNKVRSVEIFKFECFSVDLGLQNFLNTNCLLCSFSQITSLT